ncbi:MAG: acetolactate synthase 3 large subunit [Alphaproteobacteria bacterium]|nr:acetolactate synthase 3 large subunit [Alphaproteobacteria bacterium]
MEMNGASIVVKALVDQGVDTIFGYPGGAVLPLYDELFKQNHIRHILVRHEQGAAHAAEGYARSTGKVGVVLVTSGPGATNTITGLADALMDSIPIVCITGQVATHLIGTTAFQEADTVGITMPCTKHNYLVKNIADLESTVHEAFHIARTGRPGPVVIDLPKDIQNTIGAYTGVTECTRTSYRPRFTPDEASVIEAVELIATAKQPVFYVGGGVINAGDKACEALRKFVKLTGFPITHTLMGLGAYPGDDPQFLGMLGMHGSLEANMAMAECDVMINIGARFDDRVTGRLDGFSPYSKKIHVDIDPSSINKNVHVDIPVIGDAGVVLERMLHHWKQRKFKPNTKALEAWWKQIDKWRAKHSFSYKQSGKTIKPQYVLDRLDALLKKEDAFVTTDVGQHQMWSAQFLKFNEPKRWMTSGGLGTMGYGLPAAVGVQVGNPKGKVVCVTGEASILMNIQELCTAVQYRLPVKILILNNQYMGMVRQWQQMFHGDRHSESYMDALPDFVELAKAFGVTGLRCDTPEEVDKTLKKMLVTDGPVLVDMWVDRKENVYPMIPAGAAHNELLLKPGETVEVDEEEARMQV